MFEFEDFLDLVFFLGTYIFFLTLLFGFISLFVADDFSSVCFNPGNFSNMSLFDFYGDDCLVYLGDNIYLVKNEFNCSLY